MHDDWFSAFDKIVIREGMLRHGMDIALDRFLADHGADHRTKRLVRRTRRPRLHPTKGYRGAHKMFRGGSR